MNTDTQDELSDAIETMDAPASTPAENESASSTPPETAPAPSDEQRARIQAEREAAYWQRIAQQAQPKQTADEDKTASPAKPDPAAFANYDAYMEAMVEWITSQKIDQALAQRREADAQREREAEYAAAARQFQARVAEFKTTAPDFDTVIDAVADVAIAPELEALLMHSENGPQLVYELAKAPDQARRIAALPPMQAAREIGRFEAQLQASASAPARPSVSQAPAPIDPHPAATGQFNKDPALMSDAEWWASQSR